MRVKFVEEFDPWMEGCLTEAHQQQETGLLTCKKGTEESPDVKLRSLEKIHYSGTLRQADRH
jgi:hypothetical protein